MKRIYLDSNATTPMRPEVSAAMIPVFSGDFGNPSSIHWFGQQAKSLMDEARQQVARLINAESSEIVFVSGGTEADNLAIRGIAEAQKARGRHIITSKIEHHAVLHTCKDLEKQGWEVTWLNVSPDGLVNPEDVRRAIRPDTVLITIMHANNEIGTIQPIEEIGAIAAQADVYFHSDGVQSTGKIPVDVKKLQVDLYSISAHKIHGPKGVGALYVRKGTTLKSLMTGGGHERNRRSGTENVAGIVGFGKAAQLAREGLESEMAHMRQLRDRLESGLEGAHSFDPHQCREGAAPAEHVEHHGGLRRRRRPGDFSGSQGRCRLHGVGLLVGIAGTVARAHGNRKDARRGPRKPPIQPERHEHGRRGGLRCRRAAGNRGKVARAFAVLQAGVAGKFHGLFTQTTRLL